MMIPVTTGDSEQRASHLLFLQRWTQAVCVQRLSARMNTGLQMQREHEKFICSPLVTIQRILMDGKAWFSPEARSSTDRITSKHCSLGTCIFIISEKAHDLNTCKQEGEEWKDTTLIALQLQEKHLMSLVHLPTDRKSVSCRLAPAWHPREHMGWILCHLGQALFFLNWSKFISEKMCPVAHCFLLTTGTYLPGAG